MTQNPSPVGPPRLVSNELDDLLSAISPAAFLRFDEAINIELADLVARFNRHGLAALRIATGRGRRATYSAREPARIVAIAQRQPNRRTDGTATWSLSTLRRSLRRAGLPRVGTSTIRRVLQDAGSSYQRTRTWCPTGTAQRKRKSGVVTVVDPNTEEKRG